VGFFHITETQVAGLRELREVLVVLALCLLGMSLFVESWVFIQDILSIDFGDNLVESVEPLVHDLREAHLGIFFDFLVAD
jgi:hypothetical protein